MQRAAFLLAALVAAHNAASTEGAHKNAANSTVAPKPPGWGDSDFHVHLKGCRTNAGVFDPQFQSLWAGPYKLKIESTTELLIINPILKLRDYQPRFPPKITLNDKVVQYTPIKTIEAKVNFNETLKGYDKTLELTIADPKAGYIMGNAMTYYIRVIKPPHPLITNLKYLRLFDANNHEIKPTSTHHFNKYSFLVEQNATELSLDFKCHDQSTETRVNGHYYDTSYPYPISMKTCQTRLLVTCCYSDDEFTPNGEKTRTYLINIKRNAHLQGTVMELHTDVGQCTRSDKHHFRCITNTTYFPLISSWNNTDATLSIIDDKGMRTRMINNIPTVVIVESGTRIYKMVLTAGNHTREYKLSITRKLGNGNAIVLEDVPVLLDLWWGQGSCKKSNKAYHCTAKQDLVDIVVHYAHSDLIKAQLLTEDGQFFQNINMGMPVRAITVQPGITLHFVLKMWTKNEHMNYTIAIERPKKHASKRARLRKVKRTGPQTVAEENEANAQKKKEDEEKKKKKLQGVKVLDFLQNPFKLFYS